MTEVHARQSGVNNESAAKRVARTGWAIFLALVGAAAFLKWDTYSLALFIGPAWIAYFYLRFSEAPGNVADPRQGVLVLGLLLCVFQFSHFVRDVDESTDIRRLRHACASAVARTTDGEAICEEIESVLDSPTNSFRNDAYE